MRPQWYCALNENCHFANTKTLENKHFIHHLKRCGTKCKKILDLRDVPPMCLLFVFFDARRLCQQLNSWFVLYAGQHGKANMSFHIVVVKRLVLTHSPGPFVVYIVINLLAVLLLRVIKLASRKNRKDYGVLLTSIREW